MAHASQPRPDSGLGFQVNVLKTLKVSSLRSGPFPEAGLSARERAASLPPCYPKPDLLRLPCYPKPEPEVNLLPETRYQFKNYYITEMCSGSEAGSYSRLIDFCITQL